MMGNFTFAPAKRDRVQLVIGLAGGTGSGKTFSALKLARGLAGGDDSKIGLVNTEGDRGKHYAVADKQLANEFTFAFNIGNVDSPFSPSKYLEAVRTFDAAGMEVIIIDSFSHEWEGEGGIKDMHAAELEAAVASARAGAERKGWNFDEAAMRERLSWGAWVKPKDAHKTLVNRMLQCRAHLIVCLRADDKTIVETTTDERGKKKTTYVAAKDRDLKDRWIPICCHRPYFMYEVTIGLALAPDNPGVPIPIKPIQQQHRAAIPLDRPLSEDVGRALAEWARGGTLSRPPATKAAAPEDHTPNGDSPGAEAADQDDSDRLMQIDERLAAAAQGGMEALKAEWENVSREDRATLKSALDRRHKPTALSADAVKDGA